MEHPITPPPKLVRQWAATNGTHYEDLATLLQSVATQAARWGADQELEACCEWLPSDLTINGESLRAARRPKPPSLAEEALKELDLVQTHDQDGRSIDADTSVIRHALERLQELEKGND